MDRVRSGANAYQLVDEINLYKSRLNLLAFMDLFFTIATTIAFINFVTWTHFPPLVLWMIANMTHIVLIPVLFAASARDRLSVLLFTSICLWIQVALDIITFIVRITISFSACSNCLAGLFIFSTSLTLVFSFIYLVIDIILCTTLMRMTSLRSRWDEIQAIDTYKPSESKHRVIASHVPSSKMVGNEAILLKGGKELQSPIGRNINSVQQSSVSTHYPFHQTSSHFSSQLESNPPQGKRQIYDGSKPVVNFTVYDNKRTWIVYISHNSAAWPYFPQDEHIFYWNYIIAGTTSNFINSINKNYKRSLPPSLPKQWQCEMWDRMKATVGRWVTDGVRFKSELRCGWRLNSRLRRVLRVRCRNSCN